MILLGQCLRPRFGKCSEWSSLTTLMHLTEEEEEEVVVVAQKVAELAFLLQLQILLSVQILPLSLLGHPLEACLPLAFETQLPLPLRTVVGAFHFF